MNDSIEKRIAAIAVELERRRLLQTESLDPLSESLYEMGWELAGLDEQNRDALFLEQDILNREQFDKFVLNYSNFN